MSCCSSILYVGGWYGQVGKQARASSGESPRSKETIHTHSPHGDNLVDGNFLEAESEDAVKLGQQEGQAGFSGDLSKHLTGREGWQVR